MYANFPNPPNSSKLSLNGIGESQERGDLPSSCFSCFSSTVSLPFCSRIPAQIYSFSLSFIYLVIRVLMRNRAALSQRGQVRFGGTCLDSCSWLKEPLWMTGHCPMSSVLLHCTSRKKKDLFSFNMHMLWNPPIAVPLSLAAECLSLHLWCSLAQEQLMLASCGSFFRIAG